MLINKHDSQLGIQAGALATIDVVGELSIQIYNVFHEYMEDYVIWKYSNENEYLHRSKLRDTKFRAGNTWYSLDEAVRI